MNEIKKDKIVKEIVDLVYGSIFPIVDQVEYRRVLFESSTLISRKIGDFVEDELLDDYEKRKAIEFEKAKSKRDIGDIKKGSVVQLKSGGRKMMVSAVNSGERKSVDLFYLSDEGEVKKYTFYIDYLNLIE